MLRPLLILVAVQSCLGKGIIPMHLANAALDAAADQQSQDYDETWDVDEPTTEQPATDRPTDGPSTEQPATDRPTDGPSTEQPTTDEPTVGPTTENPATEGPTGRSTDEPTDRPTTEQTATNRPTSDQPTTIKPIEPLGPPENLEVTAVSTSEIYIYWTPPENITKDDIFHYIVSWANNHTEEECGYMIKDSDMYAANIPELEKDTLYDIYVATENEGGISDDAWVQGKTNASPARFEPSLLITASIGILVSYFNLLSSKTA